MRLLLSSLCGDGSVRRLDALIKTLNASFLNFSLPGTSEDIMQLSSLFGCKVNLYTTSAKRNAGITRSN